MASPARSSLAASYHKRGIFPVDRSQLPLDISYGHATKLQEHCTSVGPAAYDHRSPIRVEFITLPKDGRSDPSIQPQQIFCDSAIAVEEALQILDPSLYHVLVLVHANQAKNGGSKHVPCITYSLMMRLCNHFGLLPSYVLALEGAPCFFEHLLPWSLPTECEERSTNPPRAFCYASPHQWFSKEDGSHYSPLQQTLFSISSYTQLDADGVAAFTMFCNVPSSLLEVVKDKWTESITVAASTGSPAKYDHYAVLSMSLYELQSDLKLLEMLQGLIGETRFDVHIHNTEGDLNTTIKNSREFLARLLFVKMSLDTMELVVEALKRIDHVDDNSDRHSIGRYHHLQSEVWTGNLLRQLTLIRNRVLDLLARQRATEETVLTMIALRDSRTLSHNTEEMTLMARATEKSGAEVQAMTDRMEKDARLMKFLAEITAFFLPITAVATIFSMSFFTVTPGTGLMPTLPTAKYSWIYFLFAVPISLGVVAWWFYKRLNIHGKGNGKPTTPEPGAGDDLDSTESAMQAQSVREKMIRKERAKEVLKQAKARYDELNAIRPENDDPAKKRAHDDAIGDTFTLLLCAQRAMETGEDVDDLFESVRRSQLKKGLIEN